MSKASPNARVSMVTLGVENIAKATEFYEKLGWIKSSQSLEAISFMQGHNNNIILGLFGRESLAKETGVKDDIGGFGGIALALNFASQDEVDEFAELVSKSGGKITSKPQKVFWGGYSGYFSDPDGHFWEIAHNPFTGFDKNGNFDLDGKPDA